MVELDMLLLFRLGLLLPLSRILLVMKIESFVMFGWRYIMLIGNQ